jgi:hypothetical protein
MKSLIIVSMLFAQLAYSQQEKAKPLEPLKIDSKKSGCIDIDDERAILTMKPKQQLALLSLRKDKLEFERVIGLQCYNKYEHTDLSGVSSKFDVNFVFNAGGEVKYANNLHLNLESSKNLNDFKVKFDLAECIAKEFNKKKNNITKEMQILPPVCSKISFVNERASDYRKPASMGKPKAVNLK